MPYRSQDWKPAIYRGQTLTGIKQHKDDYNKFLFDIALKKIRRKKIIIFEGSESERYQAAIRAYAEFRADIYEGFYIDPVTFDEMFNRWIALKPPTRWTRLQAGVYRNHIKRHIGGPNLRSILPKDIDRIMVGIKTKAPATRKGVLSIVKSVLGLALDERIIKSLPLEKRHSVTVNAAEQKTVIMEAGEKYRAVHESIITVFADQPTWRAVFLFGLNGRRKSEILSLQWDHVSLESKTYLIKGEHSKIKQDLAFSLPLEVAKALEEIRPNDPKGLIFKSSRTGKRYSDIRSQVQKIRDHSGWNEFGFHRMRNLLSSALFGAGVEAANLSSVLGHTSPETLKQYLTMQRSKSCEIVESAAQKLLRKNDEENKVHSVDQEKKGELVKSLKVSLTHGYSPLVTKEAKPDNTAYKPP